MGDESIFGKEFHVLNFGEAIENKLLTDYQVVVIGVDDPMISGLIENRELIEINDADILPVTEENTMPIIKPSPNNQIRALRPEGGLAAILTRKTDNYWHPSKVIPL